MAITVLVVAAGASLLRGDRYGPANEPAIEVTADIGEPQMPAERPTGLSLHDGHRPEQWTHTGPYRVSLTCEDIHSVISAKSGQIARHQGGAPNA
jgi:hypothetical protein